MIEKGKKMKLGGYLYNNRKECTLEKGINARVIEGRQLRTIGMRLASD